VLLHETVILESEYTIIDQQVYEHKANNVFDEWYAGTKVKVLYLLVSY